MAAGNTTESLQDSAECWSCPSLSGAQRISPGHFIHEGRYWMVDHAYPTRLLGWLVLVLKRHAEALHDLSAEEMAEMGDLIRRSCQVLREVARYQKEYVSLYAEAPHFAHLHFHIIPRAADLPDNLRGPRLRHAHSGEHHPAGGSIRAIRGTTSALSGVAEARLCSEISAWSLESLSCSRIYGRLEEDSYLRHVWRGAGFDIRWSVGEGQV